MIRALQHNTLHLEPFIILLFILQVYSEVKTAVDIIACYHLAYQRFIMPLAYCPV